jgi:hypothetical protein
MNGTEFRYIDEIVDIEGFDYAFVHYSDFKEIQDKDFHQLRDNFLTARRELVEYCGLEDV